MQVDEAARLAKRGCPRCYGKGVLQFGRVGGRADTLALCRCVLKAKRRVEESGRPRLAHTQETAGSNPAPATNTKGIRHGV